jgi:hypothetical protein
LADQMIDRLSGLWGAQTPLGIWLEENQMTTLFFGGVNADQCVVGSWYRPRPDCSRLTLETVGHFPRRVL